MSSMNAPQSRSPETAVVPIRRWLFRTKGVFTIVTCAAMVVLGGFVLSKISEESQRNPDLFKSLPPMVRWLADHRAVLFIAVVPALVCGVLLMARSRSLTAGWTLIIA